MLLSHIYLEYLNNPKPILISNLSQEFGNCNSIIKSLIKNEYLKIIDIPVNRNESESNQNNLSNLDEININLNEEQLIAKNKIIKTINDRIFKTFLIYGVTGSGKTLVYIQAIKHCIEIGKTALLLVPEISLTPQLIDRFNNFFKDNIAVLHSRQSEGERYDAWRSILDEKVKIVIGARSAIFAPLNNLGLIIIDEEHETSYKQESPAPRYNARDAAIIRGKIENVVVVLGSATPSFESMFNAKNSKYELIEILNRADDALMPEIKLIDTLQKRKNDEMLGALSIDLLQHIKEKISKKEGVILFQNRRGFAFMMQCRECGDIPKCRNCSVTLTYHKAINKMKCHYCGFTTDVYKSCNECGSDSIIEIGYGTQRIEETLEEFFTNSDIKPVIQRMDLDTTKRKGSYRKYLQAFSNGEIDILIGTQMVAKGLDFARVTLVGVINADLQLFLPDFRASERTFQLLTQVAGRAGRHSSFPGKVLIQTAHPTNKAIEAAIERDYYDFYESEIVHRKNAEYPPFIRFILIEFSGNDDDKVMNAAKHFTNLVQKDNKYFIKLGPSQPTIFKINTQFRRILIIKNYKLTDPNGTQLRKLLKSTIEEYNLKHSNPTVKVTIDIDTFSSI